MAIPLDPLIWNWDRGKQGDTYLQSVITSDFGTAELARIKIEIKANGNTTSALVLDSDDTGVTLNDTTAGAWSFTIDHIAASDTATLDERYYAYDLVSTDANGVVSTLFEGNWEVKPRIPA